MRPPETPARAASAIFEPELAIAGQGLTADCDRRACIVDPQNSSTVTDLLSGAVRFSALLTLLGSAP
jgi:hypothetical protein